MQTAQVILTPFQKQRVGRLGMENLGVALAYAGLAYLAFLFFHGLGVMPMPVWPSAALAIIVAFYRGWFIALGLALGTILANYCILGASLPYALCIALMNTLGPLAGGYLLRRQVSAQLKIKGVGDLLVFFFAVVLLPPAMTAAGGIGSKWLLGLIPADELFFGWLKWAIAHCLGTLLFATPVFAWQAFKELDK
ncbi:MAG: MASE1 domain-containing protein [Desulfobulbus sp.]